MASWFHVVYTKFWPAIQKSRLIRPTKFFLLFLCLVLVSLCEFPVLSWQKRHMVWFSAPTRFDVMCIQRCSASMNTLFSLFWTHLYKPYCGGKIPAEQQFLKCSVVWQQKPLNVKKCVKSPFFFILMLELTQCKPDDLLNCRVIHWLDIWVH